MAITTKLILKGLAKYIHKKTGVPATLIPDEILLMYNRASGIANKHHSASLLKEVNNFISAMGGTNINTLARMTEGRRTIAKGRGFVRAVTETESFIQGGQTSRLTTKQAEEMIRHQSQHETYTRSESPETQHAIAIMQMQLRELQQIFAEIEQRPTDSRGVGGNSLYNAIEFTNVMQESFAIRDRIRDVFGLLNPTQRQVDQLSRVDVMAVVFYYDNPQSGGGRSWDVVESGQVEWFHYMSSTDGRNNALSFLLDQWDDIFGGGFNE